MAVNIVPRWAESDDEYVGRVRLALALRTPWVAVDDYIYDDNYFHVEFGMSKAEYLKTHEWKGVR